MTRKELLSMTDADLNKAIKIAGTKFDRRRKVTKQIGNRMNQMVHAGRPTKDIAEHFGLSEYAVKYNTDEAFRATEKIRLKEYAGKYPKTSTYADLVAYKRTLASTEKLSLLLG